MCGKKFFHQAQILQRIPTEGVIKSLASSQPSQGKAILHSGFLVYYKEYCRGTEERSEGEEAAAKAWGVVQGQA